MSGVLLNINILNNVLQATGNSMNVGAVSNFIILLELKKYFFFYYIKRTKKNKWQVGKVLDDFEKNMTKIEDITEVITKQLEDATSYSAPQVSFFFYYCCFFIFFF
jgi:hypothetical protein